MLVAPLTSVRLRAPVKYPQGRSKIPSKWKDCVQFSFLIISEKFMLNETLIVSLNW